MSRCGFVVTQVRQTVSYDGDARFGVNGTLRFALKALFLAVAFAAALGAGTNGSDVDADECGTFDVTPADGTRAKPPVRYIIVYYNTCYPEGDAGVGINVDNAPPSENPSGLVLSPAGPQVAFAIGFPRKPLKPGVHTVVATASERACRTCPWEHRTYEWMFTVAHARP